MTTGRRPPFVPPDDPDDTWIDPDYTPPTDAARQAAQEERMSEEDMAELLARQTARDQEIGEALFPPGFDPWANTDDEAEAAES